MNYVRQIIGSSVLNGIINIPPSLRNKNVQIIILPAENDDFEPINNNSKQGYKLNIGFLPGAEVPNSFFEPLPEEDLLAWGL